MTTTHHLALYSYEDLNIQYYTLETGGYTRTADADLNSLTASIADDDTTFTDQPGAYGENDEGAQQALTQDILDEGSVVLSEGSNIYNLGSGTYFNQTTGEFGTYYMVGSSSSPSSSIGIMTTTEISPSDSVTYYSINYHSNSIEYSSLVPAPDPDGVVDGQDSSEVMDTGFSDADGDAITTGDDSILGNAGNDTISADEGNDTIDGGTGHDSLMGGHGSDSISGGDGDDDIRGDNVWLDMADHTPTGGGTSTTLSVTNDTGETVKLWWVDYTGNLVYYGDIDPGSTVVQGTFTDHSWVIRAEDGYYLQVIEGGANQHITYSGADLGDTISGGLGSDTIYGEFGDDSIDGGSENDILYGGEGNDVIVGGAGNDMLTGDGGDDTFVLADGSGADTVTDFDIFDDDGDGFTNDQLDVSGLLNNDGDAIRVWDVAVSDDGYGNALLTFPSGDTVVLNGIDPALVTDPQKLISMGVPCFTKGTMILTPGGEVPVETLQTGDQVTCADGSVETILWAGGRTLSTADLKAQPQLRPVAFKKGAIGNRRELRLSPQHAVAINTTYGPGLARAVHLAKRPEGKFRVAKGVKSVAYHHILLPKHALLVAEGAIVESMWPGPMALAALGPRSLVEIACCAPHLVPALNGEVSVVDPYGPPVLPQLKNKELRGISAISAPRIAVYPRVAC